MEDWPDKVEAAASWWKDDCHDTVYGLGNWWISIDDTMLPVQIYERVMWFATPAVRNDALTANKGAGVLGSITDARSLLLQAEASMEKSRLDDGWKGAAAEGFNEYLTDLNLATRHFNEIYLDALKILVEAHDSVIVSMKKDLLALQQATASALEGEEVSVKVGAAVVSGLEALVAGGGPAGAGLAIVKAALSQVVGDLIDKVFGGYEIDAYYSFRDGLGKLQQIVRSAVECVAQGYRDLGTDIARRKHLTEPAPPSLVTDKDFEPAMFMLAEYLDLKKPPSDGEPAEYEVKPEYADRIEPKVSSKDVVVD